MTPDQILGLCAAGFVLVVAVALTGFALWLKKNP